MLKFILYPWAKTSTSSGRGVRRNGFIIKSATSCFENDRSLVTVSAPSFVGYFFATKTTYTLLNHLHIQLLYLWKVMLTSIILMLDRIAFCSTSFITICHVGVNNPFKSKSGNFWKKLVAPPDSWIIAYDRASCFASVITANLHLPWLGYLKMQV